jgi:cysteine desulfuration protein SufE
MLDDLTIEDVTETFSLFDDWEDKYSYLIDIGRLLPTFPDDAKTDINKVRGCTSQVWILPSLSDDTPPRFSFIGDSDAHIVKGLVAITMLIYSGKTTKEVLEIDVRAILDQLGLAEHLSPSRSNGLFSMITRIREMAASANKQ